MLRANPLGALLAAALALFDIDPVNDKPSGRASGGQDAPHAVTIRNNRGGHVVDYIRQVEQWSRVDAEVRFAGRCESACTLYLALPASNTCIARGASFGFHAPRGGTANVNRAMTIYMTNSYPEWVQLWLKSRGGLGRRVVTMNYRYASRFIRPCVTASAAVEATFSKLG